MKFLTGCLLFAILAVAAHADDHKIRSEEDLMKARKECAVAKKVTPELIAQYTKFEYPDDEITRCYIECILEKFELFDPQEGWKMDNLMGQLSLGDNAAAKADLELCADKNENKSDACTHAYRGFKCFMSKNLYPLAKASLKKE